MTGNSNIFSITEQVAASVSVSLTARETVSGLSMVLTPRKETEDLYLIDVAITAKSSGVFPEMTLEVHAPFVDMHSCWTPGIIGNPVSIRNKGICEWRYGFDSQLSTLAPACCFYNIADENRLSAALSETMETVRVHTGAYEEERRMRLQFTLFSQGAVARTEYRTTLRLDMRTLPFYRVIEQMAAWYENSGEMMPVPEAALEPVFSTWYAFHQKVSQQKVYEQCKAYAELGCKAIILDDGWQTDDEGRGYQFCGDWEVAEKKFPDLKAHVADVQALGMKYLVWFSVPFVGKKSQAWPRFKDKLLSYNEQHLAGVLDPRYPEVRTFLIDTYCQMVQTYHLDGVKLDFIDEFTLKNASESALAPDADRDYDSLQQAVDVLLTDIRHALEAIQPDIMIEFRQRYIGPMIRRYGNIFRVHDCPNDPIMNRMSIMDLRLFSGNTAVHSDMIIWSPEDTAESAALHFINTLFSVQQLSPCIDQLPAQHITMMSHWLRFWKKHRIILLEGTLTTCSPEMQYPAISAQKDDHKVMSVHGPLVVDVFNTDEKQLTLVNGTLKTSVAIRSKMALNCRYTSYDVFGEICDEGSIHLNAGLTEIDWSLSGYITFNVQ